MWTWAGTRYCLISKTCTFPDALEISEFVLALLQLSLLLGFYFLPGPDPPQSGISLLDLNQHVCKTECFPTAANTWAGLTHFKGSLCLCLWQRKVISSYSERVTLSLPYTPCVTSVPRGTRWSHVSVFAVPQPPRRYSELPQSALVQCPHLSYF